MAKPRRRAWPLRYDLDAQRALFLANQRERFRTIIANEGDEGLRAIAQEHLQHAGHLIAMAFNLAHNPELPYAFDDQTQLEATQAIMTLILLMRRPIRRRSEALAATDAEFQRFIGSVLPRA